MRIGAHKAGSVTTAKDARITRLGRLLRRCKLDELPQLWNVLIGEMSFVGPRPDVPGYADKLQGDDREFLELLPGITGPATLLFREEENLLAMASDPLRFNDDVIYPEKIRINKEYLANGTVWGDIGYIIVTLLPSVTKRIGLDRQLGLDHEAFHERMMQALVAEQYGKTPPPQ